MAGADEARGRGAAAVWLCVLALAACADDPGPRVLDLEGPRGRAVAPGPWLVEVLVSEGAPVVWLAIDDGPFERLPLVDRGAGRFAGLVPGAPVGTALRYYAQIGDALEPETAPAVPRTARVVALATEPDAAPTPPPCALRFRRPLAGDRLRPPEDDGAPQAGLQITVVVETSLPDGAPVRLLVQEEEGAAAEAEGGVVAFEAVTLPPGAVRLTAEATPRGGEPCAAEVTVSVEATP